MRVLKLSGIPHLLRDRRGLQSIHPQGTSHLTQAVLPGPGQKVGLFPALIAGDPVHQRTTRSAIAGADDAAAQRSVFAPKAALHLDEGRIALEPEVTHGIIESLSIVKLHHWYG